MLLAVSLAGAACLGQAPAPGDEGASPSDADDTAPPMEPLAAFLASMDATGHDVREGGVFFSTYDGCCDEGAQCFGNNPATPYGTHVVPTLPDEAPSEDVLQPWGTLPDPALTRSVRLRHDEALVYIGRVPPESAYFSVRSYQLAATDEEGEVVPTIGSLGEPLNHLSIAAERGVDPSEVWGTPLVVITSADRAVENRLRARLEEAGFDPAHIHADRMTYEVLHMGLDAEADLYGVVWRVALPTDEAAGEAYRDDHGGVVLRVTPRAPRELVAPHPRPSFQRLGAGTDEEAWTEALDALQAAILAAYPDAASLVDTAKPSFQPTLDCLARARCAGDIRDRMARVVHDFILEDDAFVVAFGVNHQRTGKASYSNVAVVEEVHGLGLAGFSSADMPGSARAFLPDEPLVDDLFVWMVRRDCSGQTVPCVEVPTGCPGVDPGGRMRVTFRAYLDPSSGVAPAPWEMRPDRVIKFWSGSLR